MPRTALVLTGGGARAAYQVGLLRVLARRYPDWDCDVYCGVSAGAINASQLAARPGSFADAVEELAELWCQLTPDKVFDIDFIVLARAGLAMMRNFLPGRPDPVRRALGLVDTTPLREFLSRALDAGDDGMIPRLQNNLDEQRLRALSLTTIDWATGRSVTWVHGRGIEPWRRPSRESRLTPIGIDHVMASASLPFLFPAIQIDDEWHGDGGVRLVYPLAPAVHMDAQRILAISTRYRPPGERERPPDTVGYPPPAQLAGVLMNAVFLDQLDQDAERMLQVNQLLRTGHFPGGRPTTVPAPGRDPVPLRPIDLVFIRPSVDLGRLAGSYQLRHSPAIDFLMRILGTRRTSSPDVLSMLMFQRDYVEELIAIGEKDGEAQLAQIDEMMQAEA